MKKSLKQIIIGVIAVVCATCCVACSAKSAYDIAVENGFKGTQAEWLESLKGSDGVNGKDYVGEKITIEDLYQAAKNDGYTGSLSEFIKDYVYENVNVGNEEEAINKALLSVGKIVATFTSKPYMNYYGEYVQGKDVQSGGAGVIYKLDREKGDAYIITNYHVVYSSSSTDKNGIAKDIKVYFYGYEYAGSEDSSSDISSPDYGVSATYVGGSMNYDIAVLKIENSEIIKNSQLRAVQIAESNNIAVGTKAIAVGNPDGAGIAATSGIVSVDSEYITMLAADDKTAVTFRCMRVDCAVNPGNSGGGLFNEYGQLIGIVNAKIVKTDVENMGYAIPSSLAVKVADNIIWNCGESSAIGVSKCLMGVTVMSSSSKSIYDESLKQAVIQEEVKVSEDLAETSMAYGKIKKGDVLLSIEKNGIKTDITRRFIIVDYMLAVRPGDTLKVTLLRGDTQETVEFVAEEKYFATIL